LFILSLQKYKIFKNVCLFSYWHAPLLTIFLQRKSQMAYSRHSNAIIKSTFGESKPRAAGGIMGRKDLL
jgi:hypothetical protein